jgi:hypothetical protein
VVPRVKIIAMSGGDYLSIAKKLGAVKLVENICFMKNCTSQMDANSADDSFMDQWSCRTETLLVQ